MKKNMLVRFFNSKDEVEVDFNYYDGYTFEHYKVIDNMFYRYMQKFLSVSALIKNGAHHDIREREGNIYFILDKTIAESSSILQDVFDDVGKLDFVEREWIEVEE